MEKVLIVGASRGIGFEFCRQLKARGAEVIATVRKSNPELKALGVRILENVEVTSPESLKRAAAELKGQQIDLLVHNAGIFLNETFPEINFDTLTQQLEVNAVGPLRSVQAFHGLLKKGSKVAFLTSRMGSIADNTSGGYYGYRMSKAALNAAGKSLAVDLRREGIAVALLHPGYVKTDMTDHAGDLDPKTSVEGMLKQIDKLSLTSTGSFWHTNGEVLPW